MIKKYYIYHVKKSYAFKKKYHDNEKNLLLKKKLRGLSHYNVNSKMSSNYQSQDPSPCTKPDMKPFLLVQTVQVTSLNCRVREEGSPDYNKI